MVLDLLRLLLVFSFHLLQVDKLVCRVLPSASDHSWLPPCLWTVSSEINDGFGERGHIAIGI